MYYKQVTDLRDKCVMRRRLEIIGAYMLSVDSIFTCIYGLHTLCLRVLTYVSLQQRYEHWIQNDYRTKPKNIIHDRHKVTTTAKHHSLHWVRTTGTSPVESRRHMSSMGNVTLVLLASNVRSTNAHANPSAADALDASDALISMALVSVGVASSGGSHPVDQGA